MPYTIVKEGTKWVVRKKLLKGKIGRAFGHHDSKEKAERQIAAIHASEEK